MVGRLKPDTTIEQARARFNLLTQEMRAAHPEEWMAKHDGTGKVRESYITVVAESETRVPPDMQTDGVGCVRSALCHRQSGAAYRLHQSREHVACASSYATQRDRRSFGRWRKPRPDHSTVAD